MTGKRIIGTWTAWAWLTLAAIFAHALLPVGSPVARTTGSPFSTATVDVSTAPARRLAPVQQARTDDDPGGRSPESAWHSAFALPLLSQAISATPAAILPTAIAALGHRAAHTTRARAPPLA